MIGVESDDPILSDLLASTLDLLADAGGWVNPRTILVARDGQFSVECSSDDDEPLLFIPREALVRVDAVVWADHPWALRVAELPDDIGDIELSLLYVQAAIHNQVERLPWIARTHPVVAELPDEVVTALRTLVPGFRSTSLSPRDVLFANRCLQVDLGDGRGVQRVLIPVLDLLNHHPAGARPSWDGTAFTLSVHRPFGTVECALDYGLQRDALELAAVYGFASADAAVAHLPHLTTRVTGVTGVTDVSVVASGRQASGEFAPLSVHHGQEGTQISHLTFTVDAAAMRRLVDDVAAVGGLDPAASRTVLRAVGEEALERTRGLQHLCSGGGEAITVLRDAASRQCAVLSSALEALDSD